MLRPLVPVPNARKWGQPLARYAQCNRPRMTGTPRRLSPLSWTAAQAATGGWAGNGRLAGGLDEPDAHRLTNRVDAVVDVQLPVDVADVGVHRALGDDQLTGDLAAGEPLGEQREDLPLTTGEQVVDVGRGLGLVGV